MGEVFAVGDRIEWWSDNDGGPAEPGNPAAKKHTGTVASVHRNLNDDTQVVAYLVTSRSRVAGTYTTTVRPDLHRPTATTSYTRRPARCYQTVRSGLVSLTCVGGRCKGQEVGRQRTRLRDRRDRGRRAGADRANRGDRRRAGFVPLLVAAATAHPRRRHRAGAVKASAPLRVQPVSAHDLRTPEGAGQQIAHPCLSPAFGDLGMWLRGDHVRYDVRGRNRLPEAANAPRLRQSVLVNRV